MKNLPQNCGLSLTDSRWIGSVTTVGTIGVSILSGWSLADEGFFVITGAIVPLEIGICSPHLDTVLFVVVVVWLTYIYYLDVGEVKKNAARYYFCGCSGKTNTSKS